jgi:hypothetical protein
LRRQCCNGDDARPFSFFVSSHFPLAHERVARVLSVQDLLEAAIGIDWSRDGLHILSPGKTWQPGVRQKT